eukprot:CAMPEP_0202029594 /NCGR_PEP_ID=MMETSP0905-20130828/64060_1 /ASSEMBLY_ACC=CAM_ASM_000554 /TAXON_ID=420261 /ORGANISM="Thalassiosira antarctica, Strain CCMP982" /LENGTH=489 /DNA_ID=CAMNT_0048593363 /DNA_START=62 /DNA_END=1531 /DNA_ORIENTATION=-
MTPTKAVIITIALCVGAQLLQLKHNSLLFPLKQSKSSQVLDEDIANIKTAMFSILSSENDIAASIFAEETPVIETASGSNLSPGSDPTPSRVISSFTSDDNQEKLLAKISHGDFTFPDVSSDTETKSLHEIASVTAEDTIDDDLGVVKTKTNFGWPHRVQSSSGEWHVSETVSDADSEDVPSPLEHDGAEENSPLLGLAFVEETLGIETASGSNLSPGSDPTPSRVISSFTSDDNQEKLLAKISHGDFTFPDVSSDTETKSLHEIASVTAEDTIDDDLGVVKTKTNFGWPHRVQSSSGEWHVSETVSDADSEDVPSPLEHDGAEENSPLLGLAFVEETLGIETASGSNLSPGSDPTPSRAILSFTYSYDNQEKSFDKIAHVSETFSGADSEDVPSPLEHDEGLGFRFFYICGESFNASEPEEYRCLLRHNNTKKKGGKKQPGASIPRRVKRYTARSRKFGARIKKRALQSLDSFRDGYIALVENDDFFL